MSGSSIVYTPPVTPLILFAAVLIGNPFPALDLSTPQGAPAQLAVKNHRILVVDFFATWCEPCRESLPVVDRLRQRFGSEVDFVSLAEDDDAAKVAAFAAQMKMNTRVLIDPDRRAYHRLGAHTLPTTYVIDGDGVVRKINHGFGKGYAARMTGWLEGLLGKR